MELTERKHGKDIFCDCCHKEKIAELFGDRLIIKARRHGRNHISIIKISDLDITDIRTEISGYEGVICIPDVLITLTN